MENSQQARPGKQGALSTNVILFWGKNCFLIKMSDKESCHVMSRGAKASHNAPEHLYRSSG
jgi:hypothetical protein